MIEAAKATRRYWYELDKSGNSPDIRWAIYDGISTAFIEYRPSCTEVQAECDRLNAVAFLRAIREPSEAMLDAIGKGVHRLYAARDFTTIINTLIAEMEAVDA